MKNYFKIFTLMVLFTLILTGCASKGTQSSDNGNDVAQENTNAPTDTDTTPDLKPLLRIGMMSSYDAIPFVMVEELGLNDQYHFDLALETFTSSKDRDAAFLAGELDGVLVDPIGVTMYHNADFDVRITGITDGDYVLIAGKDSGITSLKDIANRSIAISENTVIDYNLDYILEANDMNSDSIVKEIIPRIPDRLELLRAGQVDLGLLPEPFASIALNDGGVYIASVNDLGLYPAVSAFSMEAITEKEEAIINFYQAYNEAVEYLNNTELSTYEDIVIEAVGYPAEMAGQIEIEPFRISTLPSKENVDKAIEWSINRGLTKADLSYDQIVYDVYNK